MLDGAVVVGVIALTILVAWGVTVYYGADK